MEIPEKAIVPGGLTLLGLIVGAAKGLWSYILRREDQLRAENAALRAENTEMRSQVRAEQQDHIKTLRLYAALQMKLERQGGASSNPPPNS